MSDDHGKKSWKEIDQMRDRGGPKPPRKVSANEARAQKLASKAALANLDKLFSPKGLSPERARQLDEMMALRGKPGFYEKMTDFFAANGCPRDWDLQLLFLDHRDPRIVIEVLKELQKTAPLEKLEKQDFLAQKLRVLAVSTFDSDLVKEIESLQRALLRRT
jgi:hypothetical protein